MRLFSKSLAIGLPASRVDAYLRRPDSVRVYWTTLQNLGHNKCDAAEKLQADLEAARKRDERVRDREMKRVATENEKRLREEIEAKR